MNKQIDYRKILFGIPRRDEVTIKKVTIIILFTCCAIALNFFGSILAEQIIFPLDLDSILTFFVTASFGLIPGLVCAFGSNLMLTIFVNSNILFVLCHLTTVILGWIIFIQTKKISELNGEITFHFFLWAALCSAIPNRIFATYFAGFIENLTDKMISACISFTLYKFVFGRISKLW